MVVRRLLWSEDVLFEYMLLDERLQVPSKGPTVYDLIPFAVVEEIIFLDPESEGM